MSSFKQFLQFYFIGLLLILATALLFGNNFFDIIDKPGLYIMPAIFCLVGFIIGWVVYEFNLRSQQKKKKIFFYSSCFSLLALLTITIILGVNRTKEINHKKQFRNVESNRAVMKDWVYDSEEYIRIAFNRLEKEFKNPNEFILDAFSVRKNDTIINHYQDTLYNIYFVYFLKSDTINKYFSKVSVLKGQPELTLYNIDTRTNEEYFRIKTENVKEEQEMIRVTNRIFKQLKDSLKKE
jgi:hypothetical protein